MSWYSKTRLVVSEGWQSTIAILQHSAVWPNYQGKRDGCIYNISSSTTLPLAYILRNGSLGFFFVLFCFLYSCNTLSIYLLE